MRKQSEAVAGVPRLVKGAVAVLATLVCILAGTVSDDRVNAQGGKKSPDSSLRAFYLTPLTYDGSQVLTACAAGYHMASIWEILDPSNLRYDTTLGFTDADSGSGPPTPGHGWIRTGRPAVASEFSPAPNCFVWSDNRDVTYGAVVGLTTNWSEGARPINPWVKSNVSCSSQVRVWCVQD
jgi:hypothetical protein